MWLALLFESKSHEAFFQGASGCLVFSFAQNSENEDGDKLPCSVTKAMIDSMQDPQATKTYLALCDGDGSWNGIDYLQKGWFSFDKPVKDEFGKFPRNYEIILQCGMKAFNFLFSTIGNMMEDCRTDIRFIASKMLPPTEDDPENLEGRKVSIVLARPHTGRWHQVRQHLSSGTIGHAILGDSSHGRSRTNRIWKKKRHLIKERTCLHLARVQLLATEYTPDGIDVSCPLAPDLMKMLNEMPELLDEARPILSEEGIKI